MVNKDAISYPKILVISNNPFSRTENNGKTLSSFFDEYSSENIGQLYFSSDIPDNNDFNNYFKISDSEVAKKLINKDQNIGSKVYARKDNIVQEYNAANKNKINYVIKKANSIRLIRESIWNTETWKNNNLESWLDSFSPEIIFFCAGDSGFAYNITEYIKNKYNAKLVIYITDDYILPRKTFNFFWWFRRNYILRKMQHIIATSDLFFCISDKMRQEYKKIFNKDSLIAINMSESMKHTQVNSNNNEIITLVYTGGLHFNRDKTLKLLAKAIKKYNTSSNNKKAILKIYSTQQVSNKSLETLNIENASEFCGSLNPSELKIVLNNCDIPVHVESFDLKSIEATRLSVSTKIPEYLSLEKPVLAIGPNNIASIEYLQDSAFCISDSKKIYDNLERFLNDDMLQKKLAKKAAKKYENKHTKDSTADNFMVNILNLTK